MKHSEELEEKDGSWPFSLDGYDRNHQLYEAEVEALSKWHSIEYNPHGKLYYSPKTGHFSGAH